MLNIKKLLTKVLTSKVGLAYVGNVYWWQKTWTCPNDGIATMRAVTDTSGNKAYWYAKDNTTNVIVGQINQTADGTAMSASFPCIKGHVYTTSDMDQIGTAEVHYYKLTWGGYFITSFMSTFVRCLGRRWSYVERKENAYQNIGYADSKGYNARNCSRVYNRKLGLYGIKCICKKIWAYCQREFYRFKKLSNECKLYANRWDYQYRISPSSKFRRSNRYISGNCGNKWNGISEAGGSCQRWKCRSGCYNVSAGLTISERGWACA